MNKILVVVDMQNDFITGALKNEQADKIADAVAEKIKNFDGMIYTTRDTHFANYLNTSEGRHLPVVHCVKDTYGWELDDRIKRALVGKNTSDVQKIGFASNELPIIIDCQYPNGDFEIEIVGVCTDICVVSNALMLKSRFPENKISVCADLCAGTTPQAHDAAVTVMRSCQIEII